MAAGTPEEVAAVEESYTGRFLREAGVEPAAKPARGARSRNGAGPARRPAKVKTAA
jgi:excinuclease ABC subunit A